MFTAVDPTTGRQIRTRPLDTDAEVEAKLARAHEAATTWGETSITERGALLLRVAGLLRERADRYAVRMVQEVGKPVTQGQGEVAKTAWAAEHYAAHASSYLADQVLASDAADSRVRHLPLGPVFGILPWNSPFWLASRVFSPALMAGDPVLLKHDPHVPGCAEDLAELFRDAGAPPGVFDVVFVDRDGAERILRDRRIAAVSLTGSTAAGRAVGRIAGEEIKPVVLELGGSDPCLVFPDADLDAAIPAIGLSRTVMMGQSCIAAKRLIVHEDIHDDFVGRMKAYLEGLVLGDPRDPATQLGPIARQDLRDALHGQVRDSVEAGATCITGGEVPDRDGWFYPATLLTDVTDTMRVWREETFGPVAVVRRGTDEADMLTQANDTDYGLAASIWTADLDRADRLSRRIRAGQVAVNGLVKTDPRLPSGGIKQSGLGRELGPHGIRMFVNVQQVWTGPKLG